MASAPPKVAVFLPSLSGGGVAPSLLNVIRHLRGKGHEVDLVLSRAKGPHLERVPEGVRVLPLRRHTKLRGQLTVLRTGFSGWGRWLAPVLLPRHPDPNLTVLPSLVRYLRRERPPILLTAKTYPNLIALMAVRIAGTATRVVVSEHTQVSRERRDWANRFAWRHIRPLLRRWYPEADGIIAVSRGVAEDLAAEAALPPDRIHVIPNPVVSEELLRMAAEEPDHPWLRPGEPPVVIAVGRLQTAKDFPTLLRAFARLQDQPSARLIILGEGPKRPHLESLARELGIADRVDLPGFVANPYAYLARASLFALSSTFEGLGNALIEAMACGVPVVSTDCPSGPAEILEGGRYGRLVPVGDPAALARVIGETLVEPPEGTALRERAWDFGVERAGARYRRVLLGEPPSP